MPFVLNKDYTIVLLSFSTALTGVFTYIASSAILCRFRSFDNFSVTLVAFSIVGMLLMNIALVIALIDAIQISEHDEDKVDLEFVASSIEFLSSVAYSLTIDIFAFRFIMITKMEE